MALYQYEYLTKRGKKISCIQAESLEDAKIELSKQKKAVLKVTPFPIKQIATLSLSSLSLFTQELAKLLQAGLPLFEALYSLEEKYQNQKTYHLILDLKDQVKSGQLLSQALNRHPKTFDSFYICLVKNGEASGSLFQSLEEIAQVLEKKLSLRKKILSALLYPCMLMGFCLVVLMTLLFYVIPSLADLLEDRPTQSLTRMVLFASSWCISHKMELLLFSTLIVASLATFSYLPKTRQKMKEFFTRLPILRGFAQKIALLRFCKSLSSLLKGGVPLLQALQLAKNRMGHPSLEKTLFQVEKGILEGGKLSEELGKSSQVPRLMVRLLALSEQGGNVSVMLDYICQIYEEELERSLLRLTTLLQPALLIFLGAVVGLVLISVLLPLTDMSALASGL